MARRHSRILFLIFIAATAHAGSGASAIPYVSPVPGSLMNPTGTSIIFRAQDSPDRAFLNERVAVEATGEVSGPHRGRLVLADDGMTVIFRPSVPFAYREIVSVRIAFRSHTGKRDEPARLEFSFTTGDSIAGGTPPGRLRDMYGIPPAAGTDRAHRSAADTLPADFPALSVIAYNGPPSLTLFMSDFPFDPLVHYTPYLMTIGSDGAPTFLRRMQHDCFDFKRQPNGLTTYFDNGPGCFLVMDSSMAVIDTFRCGNGYPTDLHDLLMLPDGHALLLGYDGERMRMDTVVQGGDTAALVYGTIL
ncbi:MAG TPA: hypothetical protein VMM80_07945, partial [Bacteroidota bacterium]|nr:hypothetical protein [Bacteroidota bacterium]